MTLPEAKLKLAQDIAELINNSKLPPTICRMVLMDIDRSLAQLEEDIFQKSLEKGEEDA